MATVADTSSEADPRVQRTPPNLLSRLRPGRKESHDEEEPFKPVIQTSLPVALARCCVHILPIIVSITDISLNLGHLYLGRTIPDAITENSVTDAIFQVLAKLQELLIIASLATLISDVIRISLVVGRSSLGVPWGRIYVL